MPGRRVSFSSETPERPPSHRALRGRLPSRAPRPSGPAWPHLPLLLQPRPRPGRRSPSRPLRPAPAPSSSRRRIPGPASWLPPSAAPRRCVDPRVARCSAWRTDGGSGSISWLVSPWACTWAPSCAPPCFVVRAPAGHPAPGEQRPASGGPGEGAARLWGRRRDQGSVGMLPRCPHPGLGGGRSLGEQGGGGGVPGRGSSVRERTRWVAP